MRGAQAMSLYSRGVRGSRFLLVWIVLSCGIAHGQERAMASPALSPQVSEDFEEPLLQELFVSEVVRTQERHKLQVTFGSAFNRQSGALLARSLFKTEYGFSDRLQAEAEFTCEHLSSSANDFHTGPRDLAVGMRYALRRSRRFSLTAGLGVNALNPESAGLQLEPSVVAGTFLGRVWLQLGSAITVTGLKEQQFTSSLVVPLRRWRPTLEFSVERAEGEVGTLIAPGIVRNVLGFEIGVASPIAVSEPVPRFSPMFLITYEFGGEGR